MLMGCCLFSTGCRHAPSWNEVKRVVRNIWHENTGKSVLFFAGNDVVGTVFREILFDRISECALDCYLQHFYGHHFARSVDRRSNVAGQRLASNLPLSLSRKMKTQRAAMMKCPF